MDEEVKVVEYDAYDFLKPRCPVKVGDRIYRKHKNMTIPDRMEVIEVIEVKSVDDGYFIKVRYMYHAIGELERTFSSSIFQDDSWVIEKKGIDF